MGHGRKTIHAILPLLTRSDLGVDTVFQTGALYFNARIAVTEGELAKLGDNKIVPGMPAEVFVRTGDRTALAYLSKPIVHQINRAFRER